MLKGTGWQLIHIQPISLSGTPLYLGGLVYPGSGTLEPLQHLFSLPLGVSKMAEDIKTKIKNYQTAPFDSRFPNQNQTRNCWQNYLGKQGMVVGGMQTFSWSHT